MTRTAIGDSRNQQIGGVVRLARRVATVAFYRGVLAMGELGFLVPNAGNAYRCDVPGIGSIAWRRHFVAIGAGFAGEQGLGDAARVLARPGQSFLLLLLRQRRRTGAPAFLHDDRRFLVLIAAFQRNPVTMRSTLRTAPSPSWPPLTNSAYGSPWVSSSTTY